MHWVCRTRAARLAAAIIAVVTIAGCPDLNQWSGPSQDPFLFSVPDPIPTNWLTEADQQLDQASAPDDESGD